MVNKDVLGVPKIVNVVQQGQVMQVENNAATPRTHWERIGSTGNYGLLRGLYL